MTLSKLAGLFKGVDVTDYPDVHLLEDDLDSLLWVLLVGEEKLGLTSMTAAQVATVLTEVYKRGVTRQRVTAMLSAAKGKVSRRTRDGLAHFAILRPGIDRIRGVGGTVTLIDPAKAFSALQGLEKLLGDLTGDVLICDPYVDDKTLLALTAVPKERQIKLLTLNVSDPAQFRRKVQAYQNEYGNLELRVSGARDLHDRYMISDNGMWLLGQSLNGLGKKQAFVVAVDGDIRALVRSDFERRWSGASKWS